jgi:hypothetical protein
MALYNFTLTLSGVTEGLEDALHTQAALMPWSVFTERRSIWSSIAKATLSNGPFCQRLPISNPHRL